MIQDSIITYLIKSQTSYNGMNIIRIV